MATPRSQIGSHHCILAPFALHHPTPSLWWPPLWPAPTSLFYTPQRSELVWSLALPHWLISLSTMFSRCVHVATSGDVVSLLTAERRSVVRMPSVEGHFARPHVSATISWFVPRGPGNPVGGEQSLQRTVPGPVDLRKNKVRPGLVSWGC